MAELKPCPDCKGEIRIYTHISRGAFAVCQLCKKEYDICGMDQIPTYRGVRIRKSTADKIRRMWNRRAELHVADIDLLPRADAVDVVHGRWDKIAYNPYYCSVCGEIAPLDHCGESHYKSNYCPNCGAKMDGEREDNERKAN